MLAAAALPLRIAAITEELPLVRTFTLEPVTGSLSYKAGQFITLATPARGQEVRRSYSFSTAPEAGGLPAITIKRVANGMLSRQMIDNAGIGDVFHAAGGATGIFTLPETVQAYSTVWFFAAGIGITPVFSLLQSLIARQVDLRIVLVYSNRSQAETVFYDALHRLQAASGGRLRIIWFWSNAKHIRNARLSRESFIKLLRHERTVNPAQMLSYICGPRDYMWMVQLLLRDAGVPRENIRREIFFFEPEVPRPLPPDTAPHNVTVQISGQVFAFTNHYPESILASAKATGVPLPYSCNAGQCGSCTAICNSGEVWMSYNEVLTAKDMAAGRVLTCTGHAIGGAIALHF